MRTLKKTLCLVLAVVLCFGLVGTAFAGNFDDFTDADKVSAEYKEAMDVFIGLKIVEGDAKLLDPAGNYTRAAAAKIMALTVGGPSVEYLQVSTNAYKDVSVEYWAMKYIAYCQSMNLLEGYGDGNFGPNDPITGQQMAVLCLRALGYGANKEYSAADWALVASRDALKLGIFDENLIADGANSSKALTREQAIQMAFNSLFLARMEYNELLKGYVYINSGVLGTSATATYLSSNYGLISYIVTNDFGVDGHVWYKNGVAKAANKVSGWYQDDIAVAEYTDAAAVTAGQLYGMKYDVANLKVIINGSAASASELQAVKGIIGNLSRGSNAKVLAAYNGAKIELIDSYYSYVTGDGTSANPYVTHYEGHDGKIDKVVLSIEYLAKVDKVQAETTTKEAYIDLTVYNPGGCTAKVYTKDYDVTGIAKDDYVLVVPSSNTDAGFVAPISIKEVTPVEATVSNYSTSSVTAGGVTYAYSAFVKSDIIPGSYTKGSTYNFYMNSIGDVVGAVIKTEAAITDYVYVKTIEAAVAGTSLLSPTGNAAKADAIFADGTHAVIDLALTKTTSGYTYAKPADDGTVDDDAVLANLAAPSNSINYWFTFVKNADGTYKLGRLDANYAAVKAGGLTVTKSVGTHVTGGYFTTSATTVTAVTATTYTVSTFTGFPTKDTVLTGKVLYTFAKGSKAVTGVYAVEQGAATPAATMGYVIKAMGTNLDPAGDIWLIAVNGEQKTCVVSGNYYTAGTSNAVTLAAGDIVSMTAQTDGTYVLAEVIDVAVAPVVVTVSDGANGFSVGTSAYTFAKTYGIFNVDASQDAADIGKADTDGIAVGDKVKIYCASGSEASVVFVIENKA